MRLPNWILSKYTALAWLLFISVLFCLPGSAFPKESWLDAIHFDKLVHIGLFAVLIFLWMGGFGLQPKRGGVILLLLAIGYGLAVELVQGAYIANRSSDMFDLLADTCGAIAGLIVWAWYKKNKPL